MTDWALMKTRHQDFRENGPVKPHRAHFYEVWTVLDYSVGSTAFQCIAPIWKHPFHQIKVKRQKASKICLNCIKQLPPNPLCPIIFKTRISILNTKFGFRQWLTVVNNLAKVVSCLCCKLLRYPHIIGIVIRGANWMLPKVKCGNTAGGALC